MKKFILGLILGIGLSIPIAVCADTFTVHYNYGSAKDSNINYFVDDKTGVNYIFYEPDSRYGGYAICPRYNADGSLMISE